MAATAATTVAIVATFVQVSVTPRHYSRRARGRTLAASATRLGFVETVSVPGAIVIVAVAVAIGGGVALSGNDSDSSPATKSQLASVQNCDPNYRGACVPNVDYDLNCADIGYRTVEVVGSDPNGFDGDGDGIGCE